MSALVAGSNPSDVSLPVIAVLSVGMLSLLFVVYKLNVNLLSVDLAVSYGYLSA